MKMLLKSLLTIIDMVITSPAFIVGYIIRAYVTAYRFGGTMYERHVVKYWMGGINGR